MTKTIETLAELQAAWNSKADEHNQWHELGLDEIVAFAQERVQHKAQEAFDAALRSSRSRHNIAWSALCIEMVSEEREACAVAAWCAGMDEHNKSK